MRCTTSRFWSEYRIHMCDDNWVHDAKCNDIFGIRNIPHTMTLPEQHILSMYSKPCTGIYIFELLIIFSLQGICSQWKTGTNKSKKETLCPLVHKYLRSADWLLRSTLWYFCEYKWIMKYQWDHKNASSALFQTKNLAESTAQNCTWMLLTLSEWYMYCTVVWASDVWVG